MKNNEISEVIRFATNAHEGQVRKYTFVPYISHPFSVAGIVSSVTSDDEMIMAALLHDVVEDTPIKIGKIQSRFGFRVASMVADLTKVSKLEDGKRAVRKEFDLQHTYDASPEAKTIKLADLIDNICSIGLFDKKFAKIYMEEKRLLLGVLQEGDEQLYKLAKSYVDKYYARITSDT